MKERFGGEFYITSAVKKECVDRPLSSRKFKFEAIQILKLIQEGTIVIYDDDEARTKAINILELANSLFKVQGNYVKIVQLAEIESVMTAKKLGSEAVVIDEFITRTLIDNPLSAKKRLELKLHMPAQIDKANLAKFKEVVKEICVIRSVELVTVAFEFDLFKDYYLAMPDSKRTLLEGLLWGVKLNGCSVSEKEIDEVMKIEKL
jgi:hypothetical protein